ncbi:GNAT family N-acetyltransferase [Paenibacillus thiaminolyticus]|uniref:GNAT family N-acetyltransferase n=1 Tax=Paenibacillus thiaminolyticus TaxID=49283 RepID=UPI00232B42F4|nr:GNAT family N-acetyltransferase [Paenibacillus thiaminolyticus]WCF06553.1 GNAT family N-acetyltransferase [Paenibacillus thiaminolyticus]
MNPIAIVRYEPEYAAGVAEMWNRSQEGWGGGDTIRTAERVRTEEEGSDALEVYLALDQDAVVGYCNLFEYREDTGALYIGLLNVRPDYHGRRIGKMLVREALDATVRLGWPRLDLYTWASNTKAVPLYKRCGFFWEDREDTTHLMNFMPAVLNTEALSAYFDDIDWYEDSTREIEIKPDGRKDNGFDYFTYTWEKNGASLRVEFERTGRGIRLIETDDYLISAQAEQAKPVFGRAYTIEYRIVNKSGRPLHLDLRGENDRNIQFDWEHQAEVKDEATIRADFFVGPVEEEQSVWRTCPRVTTRMRVNGKEALFHIGVIPRFPAQLAWKTPGRSAYPAIDGTFHVDIENNFAEAAVFRFTLPDSPVLALGCHDFEVSLEAKERTSIAVPYQVRQYGFYSQQVEAEARLADGSVIPFTRTIGAGFSGPGAAFAGETEKYWQLFHGHFSIRFNKEWNGFGLLCPGMTTCAELGFPKLGKPFSTEFSKKKPVSIHPIREEGAVGLSLRYQSASFPSVFLTVNLLLYGEGTVAYWHEAENTGAQPAAELYVSQLVRFGLPGAVLPYNGKYIALNELTGSEYSYWESRNFTEPWIFIQHGSVPLGVCWPKTHRVRIESWCISLEASLGSLAPGEKSATEPLHLTMGGYTDWTRFRAFAMQEADIRSDLRLTDPIELILNGYNPVLQSNLNVTLQDHRLVQREGTISIQLRREPHAAARQLDIDDSGITSCTLPAPQQSIEVVDAVVHLPTQDVKRSSTVLVPSDEPIRFQRQEGQAGPTYSADNGVLRVAATPSFYPGLHSLQAGGEEWLSSGYPLHGPRSWWNPYIGGLKYDIGGLSTLSVLKEGGTAEFVARRDRFGNEWQGLKLTLDIRQHDTYKGLKLHQYFLMMSRVPVLCAFSEIEQETGLSLDPLVLDTSMFIQPGDSLDGLRVSVKDHDGSDRIVRPGKGELELPEARHLVFASDNREQQLHVMMDASERHPLVYANNEICQVEYNRERHIPNGTCVRTEPLFLLFSPDRIEFEALASLQQIRFPDERERRVSDKRGSAANEDH